MLDLSEKIKSLPALRIIIPVVTGILLEDNFPFAPGYIIATGLFLLILFIVVTRNKNGVPSSEWLKAILISFLFIILSLANTLLQKQTFVSLDTMYWSAEVTDFPVNKPNTDLLVLNLKAGAGHAEFPGKTKIFAYLEKSEKNSKLKPGDHIIFHSSLKIPENRGNPDEFDYAGWLKRQGVQYICFVDSLSWLKTGHASGRLRYYPVYARSFVEKRIRQQSEDKGSIAVMIAITLGNRSYLDREIRDEWSDAGGIHVMAVSGLHVGLIWAFLDYLFKIFLPWKRMRMMRFFFCITVLWFYAFMTGLSPSVMRSSLMFSLVSFGRLIHRDSSVYNILMISALIQLLYNPAILYDLGFQFSYSAVFSIVTFFPLLESVIKPANKIVKKITDLACVSIAAQIFTFPLTLYYFHKFPVYFIITNYILIPLVTLLMILFLLSILLWFFESVSWLLLKSCIFISGIMNDSASFINKLPDPVIMDVQITKIQVFMLIGLGLAFILFITYKKFFHIILFMSLILAFLVTGSIDRVSRSKNFITFFNHPDSPLISLNNGKHHIIITRFPEKNDTSSVSYTYNNFRIRNYLKEPVYLNLMDHKADCAGGVHYLSFPDSINRIIDFSGKRIVIISDAGVFDNYTASQKLECDYIYIEDQPADGTLDLHHFFQYKWLIIGSTVPGYIKSQSFSADSNRRVHDLRTEGACLFFLN